MMYNPKNHLTVVKIYLLTACVFLLFGSIASAFLDYPFIHGTILFFFVLIPGFFNAFSIFYTHRYLPSTGCIWRDGASLILFFLASLCWIFSLIFSNYFLVLWLGSIVLVLLSMWVLSWHFLVYLYKKKSLRKIQSFVVFSFVWIHGFLLLIIPCILAMLIVYRMDIENIFWTIIHPLSYAFIILMIGIIADRIFETKNRVVYLFHHIIIVVLFMLALVLYVIYAVQQKNPFGSEPYIQLTMMSAVPIFFLLLYWIVALWKNNIMLNRATCFALMCMSLFIFGGLMDIFFIHYHLPIRLGDTYFTVAHFHLIVGVCISMAWLSCIYHNWKKIFTQFNTKILDHTFFKIHFLITFIGIYIIFTLMYYVGLIGIPKLYFAGETHTHNAAHFYPYSTMIISGIVWVMQIAFVTHLLRQTLKSYSTKKEI